MSYEVKIMSFNISNAKELASALIKGDDKTQVHLGQALLSYQDQKIQALGTKILTSLGNDKSIQMTQEERDLIQVIAQDQYKYMAARILDETMEKFDPDIICLQEVNPTQRPEQQRLINNLKALGYTVLDHALKTNKYSKSGKKEDKTSEAVIAFKNKKFLQTSSSITQGNALTADLQDMTTKKTIRVISDTLSGFDVTAYEAMLARGANPGMNGDKDLNETLNEVDSNQNQPDVTVYAGDFNTTRADDAHPSHPERLQELQTHGYKVDENDRDPTAVDANDGLPRKYDHIAAKGTERTKVEIVDEKVEGLSGEKGLQRVQGMSDHGPVFARINVIPNVRS